MFSLGPAPSLGSLDRLQTYSFFNPVKNALYGSETWRLTENNKSPVEATEMDVLRRSSTPVMGKLRPAGQIRPPEMFYPARATLFLI